MIDHKSAIIFLYSSIYYFADDYLTLLACRSERELVKDIVKDVSNKIESAISIADFEASEPKRHAMDEVMIAVYTP